VFVAVVIAFAVVAVNEFYNFISAKGANPHRLLGTLGTAALPVAMWIGDAFWATSLMTAVLLTVMIIQLVEREIHEAIASVSATFFGVFYVGWLLSHAVSVRMIERDLVRRYGAGAAGIDVDVGFFYFMLCITVAVLCDAGAYFVGRAYGKRKLAPAISPNKTVEGALGGMATGAVAAVLAKLVFDLFVPGDLARDFGYGVALIFGIVVSAVAILGDLVESLLKRDAALKDAGALLPGVGGVLDRIDSGLLAIPVTYYLLLAYYFFLLGA
jgi:phosphatidate cytidylyltransferase